MTTSWDSPVPPPDWRPEGFGGWLRVVLRGLPVALITFGGLAVLLLVRLIERPLYGVHRPWTPSITVGVCRAALRLLGLKLTISGKPLTGPGALVANHTSWLDIFVLNAPGRLYFVSKSEVAGWPGIGWLARATGTVFIKRDRKEAQAQTQVFEDRLAAGHRLLFFPEGTSTDGMQVLAFKPTLFQAFFADALRDDMQLQAVSVTYMPPKGRDPRLYGWWGDMAFGAHLLATLAHRGRGAVHLTFHPPQRVSDHASRKTLATALEAQVRSGHGPSQTAQRITSR
ncbi:lysophospholipid acyltransferase family protein [Pseudaestuariivita sp.]|uniref:lysophospholipid acyltransferase family protein n=1 Tax=Pseudaestuariivita sp. TaxID=2211669 RepID=UPI00405A08D6